MTAAAVVSLYRWTKRLVSTVAREWRAYVAEQARRAAVKRLSSFDDRDLKDIGLRRCEIHAAVRRPNARRVR